ncbi:MAG: guanylate kinase [Breznakibacter sp.]
MPEKGKLIIFSAPSGSGKTTIVKYLLQRGFDMEFSISATSRAPRGEERHGVDYYFLTTDEFRQRIDNGEFLEWEEVYPGTFYGTLKSEVDRITSNGKNIVLDVDVAGGVNIKQIYGDKALSMFIQPPSVEELERRLVGRGTDSPGKIAERVSKASRELAYAPRFDIVVVNDDLLTAQMEAERALADFLHAKR